MWEKVKKLRHHANDGVLVFHHKFLFSGVICSKSKQTPSRPPGGRWHAFRRDGRSPACISDTEYGYVRDVTMIHTYTNPSSNLDCRLLPQSPSVTAPSRKEPASFCASTDLQTKIDRTAKTLPHAKKANAVDGKCKFCYNRSADILKTNADTVL